jgi:hypothetical protein
MEKIRYGLLILFFVLSGCGKQVQASAPTAVVVAITNTVQPTDTVVSPSETPLPPTNTPTPIAVQDPAVFGSLGINEIQAFALESVANAVFVKAMDGFIAGGVIQEYQVNSVTIFPGSNGLLSEIIYNVKTADPAWLVDGGSQSVDGWINGNCARFDFFTTETEYQLKNRRLCG